MPVYLVRVEDIEQVNGLEKGNSQSWESNNPNFDEGMWITENTRARLRKLGRVPTILAEHSLLPIFYGNLETIDESYYDNALSAICMAREDGSKIRGISYLHEYWNASHCFELNRCFFQHKQNDLDFRWRVIGHFGDADWLSGQWDDEHHFQKWLATLGVFERKKSKA
jgi:hypothetical protein